MIISHKYKFIFIKTRKTAGTSIEAYLSDHCDDNDIVTPLSNPREVKNHRPRNFGDFKSHMGAGKVKAKVSKQVWETYFKFAFDRNPWDTLVSFFLQKSVLEKHNLKISGTFDEFIRNCANGTNKFPFNYKMYSIKTDYHTKPEFSLDFIGRFESLEKDFKYVCDKVEIPFEKNQLSHKRGKFREKKLKFHFLKNKHDYRSYYTEDTKKIVEKAFEDQINLLGYSF